MSEDRLYELARQRVDTHNRRWLIWAVNFLAFLLYAALFDAFRGIPRNVGEFLLQAWFGAMVLHTTAILLLQDHEQEIAGEIAKLRKSAHLPEKPKRLEFGGEGKLSASVEISNQRRHHV